MLATLAGSAFAERLIQIPVGRKVPEGSVSFDALSTPGRDFTRAWFTVGATDQVEAEVYFESLDSDQITPTIGLSYNYLVPVTDFVPGLSLGVLDALNETEDGAFPYVSVTYQIRNYAPANQGTPSKLTLGFGFNNKRAAFLGVELPLADWLRIQAEHDSLRPTGGIEIRPIEEAALQIYFRRDETMLGLSFEQKF